MMMLGIPVEPLLAWIPLSVLMGGAGCLILWHRLVYLCDALAHGAILGVVVAAWIRWPYWIGVLVVSGCVSWMLLHRTSHRSRNRRYDVTLMMSGYGSIGFAFAILSQHPELMGSFQGYWIGDILLMDSTDVWMIYGLALLFCLIVCAGWRAILQWSFDPDLAQTDGYPVQIFQAMLVSGMSLLMVVSVKIIGSLLLPILLVVPAATAAVMARTPGVMVWMAMSCAALSLGVGFCVSWLLDIPSGSAVTMTAIALYGVIKGGYVCYQGLSHGTAAR
jgi:zinc transport system permease protein